MRYAMIIGGALLLAACQGNQVPYVEDDAAIGTGAGAALGAATGEGLVSTAVGAGAGYLGSEALDEEEGGGDGGLIE